MAGHAPASLPKICLPISKNETPNNQVSSIPELAEQYEIPVTFLGPANNRRRQWQKLCVDATQHPRPDFIFVACFPEKLPAVVLNWPHQKSINLHPSLLPKYRGPDPVFWQVHHNETHTGISLHILNDELDAGPILRQQEVIFPTGATRAELDTLLAQQGALAFVQLLIAGEFIAVAQSEAHASYQPWPDKNNRVFTNKSL